MEITRSTCRLIREAVLRETKRWMDENKLKLEVGRITYGHGHLSAKISVAEVADDGTVMTAEAETFKRMAEFSGLSPKLLWKTFSDGKGVIHQIVGWNSRARKRPVLTKASDGRNYSWPARLVASKFKED